jgi:hypothetical protein
MLREPGPLHLAIEIGASVTCAACGRIVDLELSCELLKSRRDGLRVTRCHDCITRHSVALELVEAFGTDGAKRILSLRAIGGQR